MSWNLPLFRASMLLLLLTAPAHALRVEDLAPDQEWHVESLTIEGTEQIATSELVTHLVTKTRPWYTPWRGRPVFDPVTFTADLQRLVRFYRAQGFYQAELSYNLEVNESEHLVAAHIDIEEGEPVHVTQVAIRVTDDPTLLATLEALRPTLPLQEGGIFTEDRYQQTETRLRTFLFDEHYGRAVVERSARVIPDDRTAQVTYTVTAGPSTVFGQTTIEGTAKVDPALVRRELTYEAGEAFAATPIEESRRNILKLDLFSSVRVVQEENPSDPTVIPIRIHVEEKPFREWQIGVGYDTEEEVRGQVRWRHNNWLGGGRQLDVQVKASFLTRHIDVSFLQPHVFNRHGRFRLTFRPQQLDEPGYLLNSTRLQPRFEYDFSKALSGFVSYRLEYDQLQDIPSASIDVLEEFDRKGVLSGLAVGLLYNTADNPLNPTRGHALSFSAEPVGTFLGGDFNFIKFQGEAKNYYSVAPGTVFAVRLKLGFADPVGDSKEVPLFERFYAGGVTSVRGYGRHRLGPISESDDPVGGRSLLEGALELRRQLTEKLGATLFLDFGQVSLESFDVPVDDLKFAAGFGFFYSTPVGPLLLDLGFPFDPPGNDQPWQIHFNIGQFF